MQLYSVFTVFNRTVLCVKQWVLRYTTPLMSGCGRSKQSILSLIIAVVVVSHWPTETHCLPGDTAIAKQRLSVWRTLQRVKALPGKVRHAVYIITEQTMTYAGGGFHCLCFKHRPDGRTRDNCSLDYSDVCWPLRCLCRQRQSSRSHPVLGTSPPTPN